MGIFSVFKENKELRRLQELADELEAVNEQLYKLKNQHIDAFKKVVQMMDKDMFGNKEKLFKEPFGSVVIKMMNGDEELTQFWESENVQRMYRIKVEMMEKEKLKRSIEVDIGNLKAKLFGKFHF